MPNDFIKPIRNDSAAIFAPELLSIANQTRQLRASLIQLLDKARHNFDDSVSPVDFSQFEALAGIEPGLGDDVFTMLDGLLLALNGQQQTDAGKTIAERIG